MRKGKGVRWREGLKVREEGRGSVGGGGLQLTTRGFAAPAPSRERDLFLGYFFVFRVFGVCILFLVSLFWLSPTLFVEFFSSQNFQKQP